MGLLGLRPVNMVLMTELYEWFIDRMGHSTCKVSRSILLFQANIIVANIRSAHQADIAAGRIVAGAKAPRLPRLVGPTAMAWLRRWKL